MCIYIKLYIFNKLSITEVTLHWCKCFCLKESNQALNLPGHNWHAKQVFS